jgi:hypothetical protein
MQFDLTGKNAVHEPPELNDDLAFDGDVQMKTNPRLTEKIIQRRLFEFYCKLDHKLVVPNIFLHYSEADLITVQKSGYVNEIEIKLNKADLKRDFKKRKHKYFNEAVSLKKQKGRCLTSRYLSHMPNYFWFAFPLSVLPVIDFEIPDYYGLITIREDDFQGWPNVYRRAKIMHKQKVSNKQIAQIARSLMFKMWNNTRGGE